MSWSSGIPSRADVRSLCRDARDAGRRSVPPSKHVPVNPGAIVHPNSAHLPPSTSSPACQTPAGITYCTCWPASRFGAHDHVALEPSGSSSTSRSRVAGVEVPHLVELQSVEQRTARRIVAVQADHRRTDRSPVSVSAALRYVLTKYVASTGSGVIPSCSTSCCAVASTRRLTIQRCFVRVRDAQQIRRRRAGGRSAACPSAARAASKPTGTLMHGRPAKVA